MPSETIRIDKWLWAARFFKTRSLAAKACQLGRLQVNSQLAKPAREVHSGDWLHIRNPSGDFHIEILFVSGMRGPAAVAQTLYRETEESRKARQIAAAERKAMAQFESWREGRPSKRDRRRIGRLRGRTAG